MGYKQDWQQSSFGGVSFDDMQVSISGGHRNKPHEFPKSNNGFTELFGSKLRDTTVEAIFLGDNHHKRALGLISRLEQGSGMLRTTYYGAAMVVCDSYNLSYTSDEQRKTTVSMTFKHMGNAGGIGGISGLANMGVLGARISTLGVGNSIASSVGSVAIDPVTQLNTFASEARNTLSERAQEVL